MAEKDTARIGDDPARRGGDPAHESVPVGEAPLGPAASADFEWDDPQPDLPGYEILGELGRGAMGIVYRARRRGDNRPVAVKMILDRDLAGPQVLARFRAEAEATARTQHPGIVQVYEVGEHAGHPFFSMELVEGGNLESRLGGVPIKAQTAAQLVEALARAVGAAHQRGIVHRDLKPANVLLTADGTPKISDFGLAKLLDSDSGQTRSGAILGSPSYMAPEQAGGQVRAIGPAADLYALGAILYELLTGRPPFHAATVLETLQQVRTQEPVPPRRLQPKVPRDLETICLKLLEKDPRRRYDDGAALAEDLGRFLAGRPILARRVGPVGRARRWCRRNPGTAGLLLALALLIFGSLVAVTVQWRKAEAARVAIARAAHCHEVLERLEQVLSLLTDAETGQRGYVITGKDAYLDPYRAALTNINQTLLDLRGLVADDPRQRRRLEAIEPLIAKKLQVVQQVIELRQSQGFEAAAALINTDRGKRIMDDIRQGIAEMETQERLTLSALEMEL